MNRALPPGDRGNRDKHQGWPSRPAGTVSRSFRLVGGVAAPARRPNKEKPPKRNPGGRRRRACYGSRLNGISPRTVVILGGFHCQTQLLADRGAGHIMHILRNPSRFTINGSICSGRVFLSCVECGARTGIVWFASRPKETPLPSPFG